MAARRSLLIGFGLLCLFAAGHAVEEAAVNTVLPTYDASVYFENNIFDDNFNSEESDPLAEEFLADPNSEFELLNEKDLQTAESNVVHNPPPAYRPAAGRPPAPALYPVPRPKYRSPWSVLPGGYSKQSYSGQRYEGNAPYNRHAVYSSYLSSQSYMNYAKTCLKSYGQTPRLTPKDLSSAFAYATSRVNDEAKYEAKMFASGNYFNSSVYSNAARHQVGTYSPVSTNTQYAKEKSALFNEYASKFLMHHFCLSKMQANYLLPTIKIGPVTGNPYADKGCYAAYGMQQQYCGDSKYRTADGSCNNLYNPYWGKAKACHLRFVPAAYEDGVSAPRIHSHSGYMLPNPRLISSAAHDPRPERSYYTNIKAMWGQYLQHDLTLTATSVADYNGGAIKCCPSSNHPQCMPIQLPNNDYYQSRYGKKCMNFVRSAPCPLCTLGPREQQNLATSFMDLSTVYGSSKADQNRLRAFKGGLLRTGVNRCGKQVLPQSANPVTDQCSAPHKSILCFDAGDPRVNQHPALQTLHTLTHRAHNIHAHNLYRVNPKWSDEKLFQEARRITIAQFQHITYHEYLPVLFGPTLMKYYDLEVNYGAGYTRYEPYTDPTTWNDYTIAGRFGHSQVTSFYSVLGRGYNNTGPYGQKQGYWLRDAFFDPALVHDCGIDAIIQGLVSDPAMAVDPWLDSDLHNYLYRVKGEPVGSDLAAFNIQRSRDHGTAPYYVYLDFCFGLKVKGWDDFARFIPYEELYVLKKLYKDWRDVELFSAVISERKVPDADLGPVGSCIVGIQYYHLKYGDRYFYSHGYQTGSFTPRQLSSLKRVSTLAYFLCLTGDYLPAVQKYAFFPPSRYNNPIPCSQFPQLNYNLWRESY